MTKVTAALTRREIADELGIPLADVDKPLTTRRICDILGIEPTTWRGYVKRGNDARRAKRDRVGLAPAPDGREPLSGLPFWLPATIAAYKRSRPGHGARTDLVRSAS